MKLCFQFTNMKRILEHSQADINLIEFLPISFFKLTILGALKLFDMKQVISDSLVGMRLNMEEIE